MAIIYACLVATAKNKQTCQTTSNDKGMIRTFKLKSMSPIEGETHGAINHVFWYEDSTTWNNVWQPSEALVFIWPNIFLIGIVKRASSMVNYTIIENTSDCIVISSVFIAGQAFVYNHSGSQTAFLETKFWLLNKSTFCTSQAIPRHLSVVIIKP